MPFTRCSHCGKVQLIRNNMIGLELGCLAPRCQQTFIARPYRRHTNSLSQFVFVGFIVFGAYLAFHFFGSHYSYQLRQIASLFAWM